MGAQVTQVGATQVSPAAQRQAYLLALLAQAAAVAPAPALTALRSGAEALVKEQTFPSNRDEAWRFTDLSAMLAVPFQAADEAVLGAEAIASAALPEAQGAQIVFVNGHYRADLSSTAALPDGVIAGSLAALQSELPELMQRLAQQPDSHEVFTALNTAGFPDAAVVWVSRNQQIETPIQILFVSAPQAAAAIAQPRCLVVAEAGSALTLVETFWGVGEGSHFTNAVSELWLDESAQLTHVRLQQEGAGTFHIGKTAVTQARYSSYRASAIALGAQVSRHNWTLHQSGEQTQTQLAGLSAIAGRQISDTHSLVALNYPHSSLDQVHKSIVDGQAHSIFSGLIAVPQAAQFTNASQLNRNLLLSDKGRVDTKPQLDIVADNVKCAHGATISQLEADEIFYLQSRGISSEQAQRLLVYAFAMEIVEPLGIPSLRQALAQHFTAKTA